MSQTLGPRLSAVRIGSSFFCAFARSCSVQMIGLILRLTRPESSSSLLSSVAEPPGAASTNRSMSLVTSSVFAALEPKMKAVCTARWVFRTSATCALRPTVFARRSRITLYSGCVVSAVHRRRLPTRRLRT